MEHDRDGDKPKDEEYLGTDDVSNRDSLFKIMPGILAEYEKDIISEHKRAMKMKTK